MKPKLLIIVAAWWTCAAPATQLAGQTWDHGDGADPSDWFHLNNWNPNVLPGLGSSAFDTLQDQTCAPACLRIRYTATPGSGDPTLHDPGIGSFQAQAPSGSSYILNLVRNTQQPSNTLTTTVADGRFFHNGAGTYILRIDAESELNAGDPFALFGPAPVPADIYGFKLELQGSISGTDVHPAIVRATRTLGYGPVEVVADENGNGRAGQIIVTGYPDGMGGTVPGRIDCAFAGIGHPQVDPTVASPWVVGGGTLGNFVFVLSAGIDNVGNWDIYPRRDFPVSQIIADDFALWPTDGVFRLANVQVTIGSVMTVPGTARLIHYNSVEQNQYSASGNLVLQSGATLELPDPASLLMPDVYPPANVPPLEFHISMEDASIVVGTHVARQGLAYDSAFTGLAPSGACTLENQTPDVCSIIFTDFLRTDPILMNSYECRPVRNRCVKHWSDLDGNGTVDLVDNFNNQQPTYAPPPWTGEFPFPESSYFCKMSALLGAGDRGYAFYSGTGGIVPLISTKFADFDGDFDVDVFDFARFQNSFTGPGAVTWFPLADYATSDSPGDAPYIGADSVYSPVDCDVDLNDWKFFRGRWFYEFNDQAHFCAEAPTGNASVGQNSVTVIVCGGPLHVRPPDAPDLNCPGICAYDPLRCGETLGPDGPMMSGGPDGPMAGGTDEPGSEAAEMTAAPEQLAGWMLANLTPGEVTSTQALLSQSVGDPYTAAVVDVLAAGG